MKYVLIGAQILVLSFPGACLSADATTVAEDITQGFLHLKEETKDLAATPLATGDGNLFLTIGVIGATALTYGYDNTISKKVGATSSKGLDRATDAGSLAGNPFVHLGLAGLIYGTGMATDSAKLKTTGEMAAEALFLADASTFLLKEFVGRGRPSATAHKGDFKPFSFAGDYDSFPSMHTASSFALASVLSSTSDSFTAKIFYYSAATFVGFSRIHQKKHWASDVVFGAALGELCGRVVTNFHASGKSWKVMPTANDQGGGISMVKTW